MNKRDSAAVFLAAPGDFSALCIVSGILGLAEKLFSALDLFIRMMPFHMIDILLIVWDPDQEGDKLPAIAHCF